MKQQLSIFKTILSGSAVAAMAMAMPHQAVADTTIGATSIVQTGSPANAVPGMAYGVSEVLKMYQGNVSQDVIVGFVQSSALPYHMTADNIIYLRHAGMPNPIITSMLQRDGQLQQQSAAAYQQNAASAPPSQQPPGVVIPSTPAPQVYSSPNATVIGGAYPDYNYASPNATVISQPYPYNYAYPDYSYSGYPYGYWPGAYLGLGWGWGGYYHGGYGHGGGFAHGGGGFSHGGGGFSHGSVGGHVGHH